MLRRNGLGDGKTQTEAASLPAGGVRPIEPFEEALQLLRRNGIAGVGHREPCLPLGFLQGEAHRAAAVFHGVVQQDGDEPPQLVRITGNGDVSGNFVFQSLPRLEGHRLKGQRAVCRRIGEGDLREGGSRGHIVRPGQRQHLLNQRFHLPGLGVDVVRPTGGTFLQRGALQQLRIGEDHGEGGFQFVGGVGEELPLLFPCLFHRPHRPAGQQDGHAQQQHWTACNEKWHHIYGGYGDKLVGVKEIDGKYYHVTYPSSTTTLVDNECPISGTSPFISYNNEWETTPQAFVMGGRRSDGKVIGDMWGYDGNSWAKISQNGIYPREAVTLLAYYTFETDTDNWSVTKLPTLIAFGGFDQEGYAGKNVYISIDMGLNWKLADDLLQFPDYIPAMGNAQALVFNRTIEARSSSNWIEYPSKVLPSYWEISTPALSRASQAPTQWDAPYIYLFGGYDNNGTLYNSIWRGIINRLSFKPII